MSLQVISSNYAVEQDGYEDVEIQINRGRFWERLFDPDPTLPLWQKTKTKIIQLPKYKPAMYRIGDRIISHPALIEHLKREMIQIPKHGSNHTFSW